MEEVIASLESWGYLLLFLYCLYGGYVGLIAAATMSAFGKMDIGVCIIIAFCANTLGSSLSAVLARYYKKDILPMFSAYSRQIALCQVWIRRYGKIAIFLSKYIHIVRFIVPLSIGISRYNFRIFLLYNTLACALWAILVGGISYFAGNVVANIIEQFDIPPFIVIPIVLAWVALLLFILNRASSKAKIK